MAEYWQLWAMSSPVQRHKFTSTLQLNNARHFAALAENK
jgi:hypothetical protein